MVRITIKDQEQTVSFLAKRDTVLRLVAACSASPESLGDLLAAADIYQRGIAAAIMSELMEFDKALLRQGPGFMRDAISVARSKGQPLEAAFQVIDEATRSEALEPAGCDLVIIDLAERSLRASPGVEIPVPGEVQVHDGEKVTDRKVTYILPQGWSLETS